MEPDVEQQASDTQNFSADVTTHAGRQMFSRMRTTSGIVRLRDLSHRPTPLVESSLHLEAIKILFGLSEDYTTRWPGILVFCRDIENSFHDFLRPEFSAIWKILHHDGPPRACDCWLWCFAVVRAFQKNPDGDPSIERAYELLLENADLNPQEISSIDKNNVLKAIFAVLCWLSSTITPITNSDTPQSAASQPSQTVTFEAQNSSRTHSTKSLRRPTSKLFYSFRNQNDNGGEPGSQQASGDILARSPEADDVLYESSLNYYSLSTVGRIHVKWVNTLTSHLDFDVASRTLSVFRFPSFCVASIMRHEDINILKSITARLLLPRFYSDTASDARSLHREILLSYRLIFGQSERSRKLAAKLLSQTLGSASLTGPHDLAQQTASSLTAPDNDPFLLTLCTSRMSKRRGVRRRLFPCVTTGQTNVPCTIFPSSALDPTGTQLQESDTYSARDDFPVFGRRLLVLQHYNGRQQPSKVKEIWRDRRNPLQWYTFWAVIWVGGVTIVLAALQLLVSIAQLYLGIRQGSE